MTITSQQFIRSLLIASLALSLLIACDSSLIETDTASNPALVEAPIQASDSRSNTLTLVTTPSEMTFYESNKGADGFEFRLVEKFAKQNNYELQLILAKTEADVYQALNQGHADIALFAQPLSSERSKQYRQSMAYMEMTTQLVYRHGSGTPKAFEDLAGKRIVVPNLEHYHEKYRFLKTHYPDLHWEFSDSSSDKLLQQVNNGSIDYTLIGSKQYIKKRSIYSRTRIAFDLYYPEPISLTLSQNSSSHLLDQLDNYLDQSQRDGSITSLKERFFGHAVDVNPRGSMTFFRRVDSRLPHYLELIERVAKKHQLDWRLLAAIAYQESHWNPNAVSPTGVRGMMMLTHKAAEDMGIENRIDPTQSLEGGAKYYKSMYRRLPKKIQEPDRSWFALAAYNVGLGHLLDARRITEFQGGNPNRWSDVKEHLPLLEKKDWYQYTRHGYARGQEPVNYVQHIRHFHDLLQWRFPHENKPDKPAMQISIKDLDDVIKEAKVQLEVTPELSTLFPLREFIL